MRNLKMELKAIYPKNITNNNNGFSGLTESGTFYASESAFFAQQQDTVVKAQADSVAAPKKLTSAQIRYWKKLQENKLLVNGKRLMEPKTDVNLLATVEVPKDGVFLPVYERNNYNTDWLTGILIFALVLFASVRFYFSKYLNILVQSVVNYSTSYRMFEEKSNAVTSGAFRLEIFFYITISVFLYQLTSYFNLNFKLNNILLYLVVLGGVLIYFIFKKLLYLAIGNVIEGKEETGEYLFNHDNFIRIAGLVLFPFVLLVAFSPFKRIDILLIAGVVVLAVFYLLLLIRGISILLRKQFSIFYLFLYLCSLEFLPLLLIYKVVVV